jgi:hypothetical protein
MGLTQPPRLWILKTSVAWVQLIIKKIFVEVKNKFIFAAIPLFYRDA